MQEATPIVVSASRRTDLPCFYISFLEEVLETGHADVRSPHGKTYAVDLRPENVHTLVFWSKNYRHFLGIDAPIRRYLKRYAQLFFQMSITGLSGECMEAGSPCVADALRQIPEIVALAGSPDRVTLRFDPIVFWREGCAVRSNISCFEEIASQAVAHGVKRIVTSFAQWYGKSVQRATACRLDYIDPPFDEKISLARELGVSAAKLGAHLSICSQHMIAKASGLQASSCIDGRLLAALHPQKLPLNPQKDPGQRPDCLCCRSRDIGSYSQVCSNRCVYCYAATS